MVLWKMCYVCEIPCVVECTPNRPSYVCDCWMIWEITTFSLEIDITYYMEPPPQYLSSYTIGILYIIVFQCKECTYLRAANLCDMQGTTIYYWVAVLYLWFPMFVWSCLVIHAPQAEYSAKYSNTWKWHSTVSLKYCLNLPFSQWSL